MTTSKVMRAAMMASIRDDLAAGVSGGHGDFGTTGRDLAALALFEAMSEVSEDRIFAGWEIGNGSTIWRWLQTGEMQMFGDTTVDDIDSMRATIVHLANACGLWWADYEYAVPLADWIAEHGPAPGILVPAVTLHSAGYGAGYSAFVQGHCEPPSDGCTDDWNAGFAAALAHYEADEL